MTHLLVTGGLGFIGSHIVERGLARGWRVTVIDSLRLDVHATVEIPEWFTALEGDVDLIVGDAADSADAVLGSVDIVSHQAAKVGLGVDFRDAPDYIESNVAVTARLLAAMTLHGVKHLVLASSMVVYGEGLYLDGTRLVQPPERSLVDLAAGRFDPVAASGAPLEPIMIGETDPVDPRNVYAASKLAQENLAHSWARSTGGRVAALRYHNVFGARMPSGTPYAGVASLFRTRLSNGLPPLVFEDGRQRRDFIDVRDVGDANLTAADWLTGREDGTFRTFNIGSGHVHTIGDFADALAQATGGPPPEVTGDFRLGDVRHITASSERAAAELDWQARQEWAHSIRAFASAPTRPPAISPETSPNPLLAGP